jgi:hypothetical protein
LPVVLEAGPLFDRHVVNLIESDGDADGVVEQQFADEETCREHDRQVLEDKPAVRADIHKFVGGAEQFVGRVEYRWEPRGR